MARRATPLAPCRPAGSAPRSRCRRPDNPYTTCGSAARGSSAAFCRRPAVPPAVSSEAPRDRPFQAAGAKLRLQVFARLSLQQGAETAPEARQLVGNVDVAAAAAVSVVAALHLLHLRQNAAEVIFRREGCHVRLERPNLTQQLAERAGWLGGGVLSSSVAVVVAAGARPSGFCGVTSRAGANLRMNARQKSAARLACGRCALRAASRRGKASFILGNGKTSP